MAIAEKMNSQMRLVLYDGEDLETGKSIYKTKSFNNVKTSANADQLYAIAQAFAPLQERRLHKVERNDSFEIQKEA
ncbi:DUF1659 domain-containing protein [Virgibacillus alimentarius]|uniref:DUF1659 domain-containing protein n=1 Tax=Virgibacillus alimentarius TaxID=698769 RepID=A0ABS4S8B8_9BACI|nr:DUF1659 domain-containing protein [Virgibacillus alimentarius]MBP2257736.1 hypothetical protein [Virgibacillus alimentarius]